MHIILFFAFSLLRAPLWSLVSFLFLIVKDWTWMRLGHRVLAASGNIFSSESNWAALLRNRARGLPCLLPGCWDKNADPWAFTRPLESSWTDHTLHPPSRWNGAPGPGAGPGHLGPRQRHEVRCRSWNRHGEFKEAPGSGKTLGRLHRSHGRSCKGTVTLDLFNWKVSVINYKVRI